MNGKANGWAWWIATIQALTVMVNAGCATNDRLEADPRVTSRAAVTTLNSAGGGGSAGEFGQDSERCNPKLRGSGGATPAPPLAVDSVQLLATELAGVDAAHPTTVHGSEAMRAIGFDRKAARLLAKFRLPPSLRGKEIVSATLRFSNTAPGVGDKMLTLDVHALTTSFAKDSASWREASSGQAWKRTNGGGDFDEIPLSSWSGLPSQTTPGAQFTFETNYSFSKAVQDASESGDSVLDLIVKLRHEEPAHAGLLRLAFSETTTPAEQPSLTIAYRDPVGTVEAELDPNDPTAGLQAAIDTNAGRVLVRNHGEPWLVRSTIELRSNQEILFEDGVEVRAAAGAFRGICDSLFYAQEVANLKLIGQGKVTIAMRRPEYIEQGYELTSNGQAWRHALHFAKATNVELFNLDVVNAGSDGIYVGRVKGYGSAYSENVLIRNVRVEGSGRNGLSVTSVKDLVVDNSHFNSSWGIPPNIGVDVEPSNGRDRIVNVLIRSSRAENNGPLSTAYGGGFAAAIQSLTASSQPVSLRFLDVHAVDNRIGLALRAHPPTAAPVQGFVEFHSSTSRGTAEAGIVVNNKPAENAFSARFADCKVFEPGRVAGVAGVSIVRDTSTENGVAQGQSRIGGLRFDHCFVQDHRAIQFLSVRSFEQGSTLVNVAGDFVVDNPTGADLYTGSNPENVNITYVQGDGAQPMRVFSEAVAPDFPYSHEASVIYDGSSANKNKDKSDFFVGRKTDTGRVLLAFRITGNAGPDASRSNIPPGQVITGATLRFNNVDPGVGSVPTQFNLHALKHLFKETEVTWNRAAKNSFWMPGADFEADVLSSVTVVPDMVPAGSAAAPSLTTFTTSCKFREAVQAAYETDGVVKLLVKLADESPSHGVRYLAWRSDESGNGDRAKGVVRPRLMVTYGTEVPPACEP